MKPKFTLPELKRLATSLHCTVTDNRQHSTIEVEADDGWSWDGGTRSCQWTPYGQHGSYRPEWRQAAIRDAIERLREEPPNQQPYNEL